MTAIRTVTFRFFPGCLTVPLAAGFVKGLFNSLWKSPFIFTIILSVVINSLVLVILGKETTLYSKSRTTCASFQFCSDSGDQCARPGWLFFWSACLCSTKHDGHRSQMLGGNLRCARQTGLKLTRIRILSFLISAVGIGLAAFLILIRVRMWAIQLLSRRATMSWSLWSWRDAEFRRPQIRDQRRPGGCGDDNGSQQWSGDNGLSTV
jgi:ribose/xylose/arabinose/galactoside ABC-type transport system permease subunit